MRVLILHNRYRQRGGEDLVAETEAASLRDAGVETLLHTAGNGTTSAGGLLESLALAAGSAWSDSSAAEMAALCRRFRPDVVHVHNFWMRLSPSVHSACRESGAAVVQTLHNYRLLCVNAMLLRNGAICENCVGGSPWPGVARRCYRGSLGASALVARMISVNRSRSTWQRDVDAFITPSEHTRSKFISAGFRPESIFVKPNLVDDPGPAPSLPSASQTAVFAGRLSPEKGVGTLLEAWARTRPGGRLLIAGGGPEGPALEKRAKGMPGVEFAGRKTSEELSQVLREARFIVAPSLCYETFGRSVAEGFAHARPALASRLGALTEIVEDGSTGLTVPAGDVAALADAIDMLNADGALADRLGRQARSAFLSRFSRQRNLDKLLDIYRIAMDHRGGRAFTGVEQEARC